MTAIDPGDYRVTADAEVSDIDLDQEEFIYHGERLSEDRAAEIAAAALRRVRTGNLVPGRKSLSGNGTHSPTIQYRVPTQLRDEAERLAERTGLTLSKISRVALEEYLERHAG